MMQEENKKSKKEIREEAEQQLEQSKKTVADIKEKISIQKQLRDAIVAGFEPTQKYLENADFLYQKSDMYIEAQKRKTEHQYNETLKELEEKLDVMEEYIPELKKRIKENRG